MEEEPVYAVEEGIGGLRMGRMLPGALLERREQNSLAFHAIWNGGIAIYGEQGPDLIIALGGA